LQSYNENTVLNLQPKLETGSARMLKEAVSALPYLLMQMEWICLLLKPTESHSSLSCPEDVWFTWGSKWITIEIKKQAGDWSWMSRTCSREGSGFGPGVRSLPVRSWGWRLPASRAASWKDHMTISLPNILETL